jgi:hypothetical protein
MKMRGAEGLFINFLAATPPPQPWEIIVCYCKRASFRRPPNTLEVLGQNFVSYRFDRMSSSTSSLAKT